MKSSLRRRILLTVAPLVALILAVGISGLGLLDNLGRPSEEIIRDNYVSLRAMADLADALARNAPIRAYLFPDPQPAIKIVYAAKDETPKINTIPTPIS